MSAKGTKAPGMVGNCYYLLATYTGKEKVFKTPSDMWDEFCSYTKHLADNPWLRQEAIKSGDMAGTTMTIETVRPFTMTGFAVYCGITLQGLKNYGTLESHKDFFGVHELIENTCKAQKFEGAAVGAFNANIIARDLGLRDNSDITSGGATMPAPIWNILPPSE